MLWFHVLDVAQFEVEGGQEVMEGLQGRGWLLGSGGIQLFISLLRSLSPASFMYHICSKNTAVNWGFHRGGG